MPGLVPGIRINTHSASSWPRRWPAEQRAVFRRLCPAIMTSATSARWRRSGQRFHHLPGEQHRPGRRAARRTAGRLERHRVARRPHRIDIEIRRDRPRGEFARRRRRRASAGSDICSRSATVRSCGRLSGVAETRRTVIVRLCGSTVSKNAGAVGSCCSTATSRAPAGVVARCRHRLRLPAQRDQAGRKLRDPDIEGEQRRDRAHGQRDPAPAPRRARQIDDIGAALDLGGASATMPARAVTALRLSVAAPGGDGDSELQARSQSQQEVTAHPDPAAT